MHNQAAFVPTYDSTNFNLMPGFPLLLGAADNLGLTSLFQPALAIKVISIFALIAWSWVLWSWLFQTSQRRLSRRLALIFSFSTGLAALWDPIIRWGTLVVRTEIWIGLFWILILRVISSALDKPTWTSKDYTRLSLYLALAAYFHFEAILLVPSVAFVLLPCQSSTGSFRNSMKIWSGSLIQVGIRTLAFLSPWLLYVLFNFSSFLDQMRTQFVRLEGSNHWISTPFLLFHSLFLDQGSPAGLPKAFNIAKLIFYLLVVLLSVVTVRLNFGESQKPQNRLSLGGMIAYWCAFYLWCSKAEVWFITLCHLTFWTWMVTVLINCMEFNSKKWVRLIGFSSACLAVLSVFATVGQNLKIQPEYNWKTYNSWINCMDREIASRVPKANPKIWQPYIPDVLVELSKLHPNYDLTRALDFPKNLGFAWMFARKADVILLTTFFDTPLGELPSDYSGPFRETDKTVREEIPFGKWEKEKNVFSQNPGLWSQHVCHMGPFWALVLAKKPSISMTEADPSDPVD